MHIISISWVRNEADVIEAFVRHHSAIFDRMIIIDNRSKDDTGKILKNLKAEGLPLDIRYDDSFVHAQGNALTTLLTEIKNEADIVVPLDADEFLCAKRGLNVRKILEELPRDTAVLVPWRTYVPMPGDVESEMNVLLRILHRRVRETPQWYKVIIPGALLKENVKLQMGSHALVRGDTDKNASHTQSETLFLGHFPVRTAEQIAGKVLGGWLSQVANPERLRGAIFQWKAIFDQLKSGTQIDTATLKQLAIDYGTVRQWEALPESEKDQKTLEYFVTVPRHGVDGENEITVDPLPISFALKYGVKRLSPLWILADSAEYLAEKVADLERKNRS